MLVCSEHRFDSICKKASSVLAVSGKGNISVEFFSTTQMKKLNKQTRGIDKETDVLSYPIFSFNKKVKPLTKQNFPFDYCSQRKLVEIGSIALCPEIIKKQASENNNTEKQEEEYLFTHGLLHLFGYTHETEEEKALMRQKEKEILEQHAEQLSMPTKTTTKQSTLTKANAAQNGAQCIERQVPEQGADLQGCDEVRGSGFRCNQSHFERRRAGFVAVVGEPNAGKSSLINAFVKEKVCIVSPKPQTTRDKIKSILTKDDFQIVFIDTPGFTKGQNELSKFMQRKISEAGKDADAILFVIDATKKLNSETELALKKYGELKIPLFIVLNKTDLAKYEKIYPILERLKSYKYHEIVPASAKTNKNIDKLTDMLVKILPVSNFFYPEDDISDRPIRFLIEEYIREKVLYFIQDEIPHGVGVLIQSMNEDKNLTTIEADIVCEKQTHKQIIIGHNGEKLKQIGTAAREQIEKLLQKKVFLKLFVKVRIAWRNKKNILNDLGYS